MSRPRMRPRFRVSIPIDAEEARRRIERALREEGCAVRGGRIGQRLELRVRDEDAHYWSPHLSVVISEEEGGAVFAEGRFGPHGHVWTMFLAIHAMVGFLGIAGAMYGLSQWTLGQEPWALFGVPLACVLSGLVYLSAFYGQGLGGEQMYLLRSFVDDALREE